MRRLGVFVTEDERKQVETEHKCSGMYLSGGIPMGDPQGAVERLNRQYSMPSGTGLDLSNGEFVEP